MTNSSNSSNPSPTNLNDDQADQFEQSFEDGADSGDSQDAPETKQGKTLLSGKGAAATGSTSTLKSAGGVATSKAITPGAGKKGKAAAADKEAAAKATEAR